MDNNTTLHTYSQNKQISMPKFLLLLSTTLLSFEMLLAAVGHHLGKSYGMLIPWLFKPALGLLVAFLLLRLKPETKLQKATVWLFLAFLAGYIISGVVQQSEMQYFLPVLILGPVTMLAAYLLLQRSDYLTLAIRCLVYGMTACCVVAIILYIPTIIYLFTHDTVLHHLPWDKLVIQLRYPDKLNVTGFPWYYVLVGNVNKASNMIVLSILLQAYLYLNRQLSLGKLILMYLPHLVLLVLVHSRGAFVVIGLLDLFWLLMIVTYPIISRDKKLSRKHFLSLFILFLLPLLIVLSNSTFRANLFNTQTMTIRTKEFSGILPTKIVSAPTSQHANSIRIHTAPFTSLPQIPVPNQSLIPANRFGIHDFKFYLFGYGVANYGLSQNHLPESGSHFLIFDTWIEGGVLAVAALLAIFLIYIVIGIKNLFSNLPNKLKLEALFGTLGIGSIFLLGLREYSFVYLFVQSLGGIYLVIFMSLISASFNQQEP